MTATDAQRAIRMAADYPRLRYMGSKYRLVPDLVDVFAKLPAGTALDAFAGSGVVAYTLKALGFQVTANDFLNLARVIASAAIVNQSTRLTPDEIDAVCGPPADDRDFISRTFEGLYFTAEDRRFLDTAWSHLDTITDERRDLAIAALILAAARKQPRGVFTVTDLRYDDGRRDLRLPLREHFRETAQAYNKVVFDGPACAATCADVFDLPAERFDVVYLDPPYAPPRDDNCYIKRYHFLEGLAVYWRGQTILEHTKTKKLAKRATPFSYTHSVTGALRRTLQRFKESTIVLSYSSNAVPDAQTIAGLLREVKDDVEIRSIDHKYSFGTHASAKRRDASEYIFIGR